MQDNHYERVIYSSVALFGDLKNIEVIGGGFSAGENFKWIVQLVGNRIQASLIGLSTQRTPI